MSPACWICGGETHPAARLAPLPFAECEHCGFVFRPAAHTEELREVYEGGEYEERWAEVYGAQAARRRDARVRLDFVRRHAAAGRLLDVGAAAGEFVAEARSAGYDAAGVEPTPAFARWARERLAVDVRTGTLEDSDLAPGALDVVTMWHVLEHIPEPLEPLERIAGALRPGGVLAIEVPNFGSAVAARTGAAWGSLQPEVHVNQFGPVSMRALLERAGFTVLDLYSLPVTQYLPRVRRADPRHVAARVKAAAWLRSPRAVHPWGHELLRVAAARPTAR